jgi:hypothetical protein
MIVVGDGGLAFQLIYSLIGVILCFTFVSHDIMAIVKYSSLSLNQNRSQTNGNFDTLNNNTQIPAIELTDIPVGENVPCCDMPQPDDSCLPILNDSCPNSSPRPVTPDIGFHKCLTSSPTPGWNL